MAFLMVSNIPVTFVLKELQRTAQEHLEWNFAHVRKVYTIANKLQ